MEIITLLFILIVLLKLKIMFSAIRWLASTGQRYKTELQQLNPSEREYFNIFQKLNAGFFPFGFKDYKLRKYRQVLKSKRSAFNPWRIIVDGFQTFLFRYERLTIVITIYLFLVVPLCRTTSLSLFVSPESQNILFLTLSVLLLVGNLGLSIEATYSYAILGSYATSFHLLPLKPNDSSGGSSFLLELKVLMGAALTTTLAGAITFYVSHMLFYTLKNIQVNEGPLLLTNSIEIYIQCLYFSLTTLLTVGGGEITPLNTLGRLLVLLFQIQSFTLIVLTISSMMTLQQTKQ